MDVYSVDIRDWDGQLRIETTEVSGGGADLFLRRGAHPTPFEYDASARTPGTSTESLALSIDDLPPLTTGTWKIGVWRPNGTAYDISWYREGYPSSRPGLGAIPYNDGPGGDAGTTFRVWAPNALAVHLAADFNDFSGLSTPLSLDGDGSAGTWSSDVRGVGDGTEYRFVITTPTGSLWRNDPRAKDLLNSSGPSLVVDPELFDWGSDNYATPDWNDLIIYELHVGTFFDAVGGAPGDFSTALQKLDYLADLGVSAIELMPVCEFPADYSWGYNSSHPFAVESIYGHLVGLKEFVRQAHGRGIAVLLDVLYNHWGPTDMDLWQFDGWSSAGWGGIYFYNDDRAQTAWGDTRPDYNRPEVRQYIRDNAMYWLEDVRLDGLRWDSTSTMRLGPWGDLPEGWSLMQWCNDEVDAYQGWKINIAEDMYGAPNDWITKDTGAGGAGFDSQWDAMFVHPLRAALVSPADPDRSMWDVRNAILQNYNGDAFERVIYTESHDEVANGRSRVPEEIWPGNADSWYSKKRSTLGGVVVLSSPGIPMLFQGQELLEDGYFTDTDPIDWTKATTFAGIHALYRDLIGLRRNSSGLTAGLKGQHTNVFHVNDGDKVLAWHRWDQGGAGDDVVVVANFANVSWPSYRIGLPAGGTWYLRFNSDSSVYDASYGDHPSTDISANAGGYDGLPFHADLTIAPYTALIFSR